MSEKKSYAILQEVSAEEYESWLYFIRYEGNEEELKNLQNQLSKIEWKITEDYNTFDLELDYLVSEQTAKDMIRVDLNATSFHRKFDGKLKNINFNFFDTDKNSRKIRKVNGLLKEGGIENFIDSEEITNTNRLLDSSSSSSEEEKKKIEIPISRLAKIKQRHKKKN